jgi:hypothetical protein
LRHRSSPARREDDESIPRHHREIALHDAIKIFRAHFDLEVVVDAEVADLLQQVAGLAAAQGAFLGR